jgi:isoleucyl-tRNA synthetase
VITGAPEIERKEKRIGASLQAAPVVYLPRPEDRAALAGVDLAELAITSGIEIVAEPPPAGAFTLEDVPEVAVVPRLAAGSKCVRCWQILPEVASSPESLCRRCTAVVERHAARAGAA